jgi:hypothetical protein
LERDKIPTELDLLCTHLRGESWGQDRIDKEALLRLAKFHRLLDLLNKNLHRIPLLALNKAFQSTLKELQIENLLRKEAMIQGFNEFADDLNRNNIAFIILKGIYFSEHIYPAGEDRQFADYDFLINSADLLRTEQILTGNGFQTAPTFLNRFDPEVSAKLGFSRTYHHPKAQYLRFDLHTRLSIGPGSRYLMSEDCWMKSPEIEIRGSKYHILPVEVGLIHLCWHALKHPFCRLLWFRDIWYYLEHYSGLLEGKKFHDLMEKYQAYRIVGTALKLTAMIYQKKALFEITERICGKKSKIKCKYFSFPEVFTPRREISTKMRILRDLSLLDNNLLKLCYLFKAFFPHPQTIPEFSKITNSRWNLPYLKSRYRILRTAAFDQDHFKR